MSLRRHRPGRKCDELGVVSRSYRVRRKIDVPDPIFLEKSGRWLYAPPCPISHVPVVACRSAEAIRLIAMPASFSSSRRATGAGGNRPVVSQYDAQRGLKQRRHGLFWSPSALHRSATEEACLIIAACADRIFPFQTKAARRVRPALRRSCLHSMSGVGAVQPPSWVARSHLNSGRDGTTPSVEPLSGGRHDRAHPRISAQPRR